MPDFSKIRIVVSGTETKTATREFDTRVLHTKFILVLPDPAPKVTRKSNLVIPDTAKYIPEFGTVVSVGSGVRCVSVGERVRFQKLSGFKSLHKGKEHLVVAEENIFYVEIESK